ncbi:hypothetical protein [Legionella saoudiensis]|uniref:hypothetical protein n=1 Tax=Legionella saoudiensis TaxID=1750561 RepID=UPI00073107D7|nr:hypothetical protein [Legionella saoudiensis]
MGKSQISHIKQAFFNHTWNNDIGFSFTQEDFNLNQLQNEFSSLYQILSSNKTFWANHVEVVLYVSFVCDLMIHYYEIDYQPTEIEKLKKQKKEIESYIQGHSLSQESASSNNTFFIFLLEQIKNNFDESGVIGDPLTTIRQKVGKLNTNRSKFGYSRALAMQLLAYLEHSAFFELIQEMNDILGNQYGFVDGINLLNQSREALAALGIILFAFRFIINLIIGIKQIIQASIEKELSVSKVLKQELEKRGFTMASDLVWSLVGLLTTYPNFFHVPISSVSPIILAFLIFDALLLLTQWLYDASNYRKQIQELTEQKIGAEPLELLVIQRQLDLLKDEWEAQCSYYAINILGAHILAISFAATLIYTGPLAIAAVALFSMLGNALYNTAEEYKKYKKAQIAVARELTNGEILNDEHHQKLISLLREERDEAHAELWNTLTFNFGGIAFIITATVVCWPVALAVTIGYIGHQLNKSYQKQLHLHDKDGVAHDLYRFISVDNYEEETSVGFKITN